MDQKILTTYIGKESIGKLQNDLWTLLQRLAVELFLVFEHNNLAEEAEALSQQKGFERFIAKKTGRFIDANPNKKEKHQAKNRKGQDTTTLKKPDAKYQNKALTKQEAILKKYGTMDAYYDAAPIVCKVKKENSLFITAEGLALPCCWTAGRMYKWWHKDPKVEQIWDYIPKNKT